MLSSILIANRGEIAVRVMRTARRMGLRCIAVYSDADRDALHVSLADEACRIGPPPAAESYLRIDAIIEAARRTGAEAVHPGYGFLSENADFAEACAAAGLVFIGPPASAIRAMGLKDEAKRLMEAAGVPVVPGYHGADQTFELLAAEAAQIGYPVLIKARAGGGGKGMRRVMSADQFSTALASAQREGASSFGDGNVIIEKMIAKPRHVEVQVFADAHGNALHLFERDCSLQRRHQKVIEEAPAPGMTAQMRNAMGEAAVKAALAVGYRGAGTVEFIVDASKGLATDRFYFMEMNTRLQVEHPVTEAVTGHDLVEWQLRVANGEPFTLKQSDLVMRGHAIEARIYAEDPERGFMPTTGRLSYLALPTGVARVDAGVRAGDSVSAYYDPMIAKVVVHAPSRDAALVKLSSALEGSAAVGCITNLAFLAALIRHPRVVAGDVDTALIEQDTTALCATPRPDASICAIAALAALGLLDRGAQERHDPWTSRPGWRQWGSASLHADLAWRGEPMTIVVEGSGGGRYIAATPEGHVVVAASEVRRDRVRLDLDGRQLDAALVVEKGAVHVVVGGRTHTFALLDGLAAADAETADEDRVTAPLPGVVKIVHARAGASVAKGDALIVMEAMKMEHTMRATRAARIADVNVAQGDLVQEGQVLVRLAED